MSKGSISPASLPTRRLGRTDMSITRVGFGAWAIGGPDWAVGWGAQDDRDSIAAIRHAIDRGINWIDTAAVYGLGHSEDVVRRALADIPASERPFVFTKCGLVWDPSNRQSAAASRRTRKHSARSGSVAQASRRRTHRPLSDALAGRGRNAA